MSPQKGPHLAIDLAKKAGWHLKMAGKVDQFPLIQYHYGAMLAVKILSVFLILKDATIDPIPLLYRILPEKDADGLHPINLGKLVRSESGFRSCTPAGVIELFKEYNIELEGKRAVVIGRSILVGKPLALMLLEQNATVTIAHSKTRDLSSLTKDADILIAAVGRPQLITANMVKPGAVVIDVGINRSENSEGKSRLVGDVDFDSVATVADYITPVPGGVGPMTVAMLLQNTVASYERNA